LRLVVRETRTTASGKTSFPAPVCVSRTGIPEADKRFRIKKLIAVAFVADEKASYRQRLTMALLPPALII